MHRLDRLTGLTIATIVPIFLLVLSTTGCAPPAGLQTSDATTQSDQRPVPFDDSDATSSDASGAPVQGSSNTAKPDANIPFHKAQSLQSKNLAPQNIPAGTLLTVRVKSSIASGKPDAAAGFEAIVDQAVIIEGNQLLPSGTIVSGLVESARASNLKVDRGYLRLTLASIHLAGSDVPVQTSSLFVRASAAQTQGAEIQVPRDEGSSSGVQLESGQRLVFRLTKPVYVAAAHRPPSGF